MSYITSIDGLGATTRASPRFRDGTGICDQITGVLIGGTSLFGGLGTITGVAIGALLLTEVNNALIVASIPPQYNTIVVGAILIFAVALDHFRRKRLYRR